MVKLKFNHSKITGICTVVPENKIKLDDEISYFKLWHSKNGILTGIFGTSENKPYLKDQYNSFQLHVSVERHEQELTLKSYSYDSSEKIKNGDDLGGCVFNRMMSELKKR